MAPKNRKGKYRRDPVMQNGKTTDIVIPVMGPTGAGKSTFINAVLGAERMEVGHQLISCTAKIDHATIDPLRLSGYPALQGRRVVIVDTPGFDDTYQGDAEILRRIAAWLENSYKEAVLGGVIYLHDVSHDRFSGTARMNLEMFNHLCGDAALSKVVLGTTKWKRVTEDDGKRREEELKDVHWKPMIDKGSRVRRFDPRDSTGSALEFIKTILDGIVEDTFLQIQTELAVDRKIIPETRAGKELRYTLQQVLDMQKQMIGFEAALAEKGDLEAQAKLEQTRQKMLGITNDLRELKIPFVRRFLKMLGLA